MIAQPGLWQAWSEIPKTVVANIVIAFDRRIIMELSCQIIMTLFNLLLLGGWTNTQSVLRTAKQQTPVATVQNTPVDCNEFRPFWIRWTDGVYEVGYGLIVGTGHFLSYNSQSTPMVNVVAVSTGFGATGTWLFRKCSVRL